MNIVLLIIYIILTYDMSYSESIEIHIEESPKTSVYGMQGFRLRYNTTYKLNVMRLFIDKVGLDFLRLPKDMSIPTDVLVSADLKNWFINMLNDHQINYELVIDDMSKIIEDEFKELARTRVKRNTMTDIFASYPRYDEIKEWLQIFSNENNDTVQYLTIGKSFIGRDIVGVKFSTGGENKPAVIIDAGIHAREWVAPITALYAIKQFIDDPESKDLLQNIDVYVIPVINPDGYEHTFLSVEARKWRKTRSKYSYSFCRGADGNRNFDFEWMRVRSSRDPCHIFYAGPKPFSEPETQALRDLILSQKNLLLYLSFHSYGNYLFHPWAHTRSEEPPNISFLKCVAEKAEIAISQVRGTHYKIGTPASILYAASGSSADWAMKSGGAKLSYTMELSSKVFRFAPPTSEIVPIGEETFEAIKTFIKYGANNTCQSD